jgi:hypothetical protein
MTEYFLLGFMVGAGASTIAWCMVLLQNLHENGRLFEKEERREGGFFKKQ